MGQLQAPSSVRRQLHHEDEIKERKLSEQTVKAHCDALDRALGPLFSLDELEWLRVGLYSVRTSDPEKIEALKALRLRIESMLGEPLES